MTEQEPIPEAFLHAFEPNQNLLEKRDTPYICEPPNIPPEKIHSMFVETSNVLDGYFGIAEVEDHEMMREYLTKDPLSFLRDAQQGNYLLNGLRTDQKKLNDEFPEKSSVERGIIWGNSFTAYRLTKAIFRIMPLKEENYPTYLLAEPPRDAEGFATRVEEINKELEKIVRGETPYKHNPRSSAKLWRTFAFIKTGADLRI